MVKYRDAAKSELDAQREYLDSLMGINRNNDRQGDAVKDFRDERVCKFFITGMCPHDLFVNTKLDEGPCPKVHSDALKNDFEAAGDPGMYDHILEREFNYRLSEADRTIKRARLRVEDDRVDMELNPDLNPDMIRIHNEMSRIIQDAERAGDVGDIDKAQDLIMNRFEDLQKEKNTIMNRINELKKQKMSGPEKKLRVCDVCGSFLSIADSDKRLSDHFLGKQHIGFQYMRDCMDAIAKRREERRNKKSGGGGGGGGFDRRGDDHRGDDRRDGRRDDSRDRRDDRRRRDNSRDRYRGDRNDRGGGRRDDYRRRDDSRGRR